VTKHINFNLLVNEYFRKSFLFFLTSFYSTYKLSGLAGVLVSNPPGGDDKKVEWNKLILRNSTKLGRVVSICGLISLCKKGKTGHKCHLIQSKLYSITLET